MATRKPFSPESLAKMSESAKARGARGTEGIKDKVRKAMDALEAEYKSGASPTDRLTWLALCDKAGIHETTLYPERYEKFRGEIDTWMKAMKGLGEIIDEPVVDTRKDLVEKNKLLRIANKTLLNRNSHLEKINILLELGLNSQKQDNSDFTRDNELPSENLKRPTAGSGKLEKRGNTVVKLAVHKQAPKGPADGTENAPPTNGD